jgi:hypothetical protein
MSPCGQYRYVLRREFGNPGAPVIFIGLNPSTADAKTDDPTIRRCIVFAKDWGFTSLIMVNLFAFRATDPKVMARAADPIGPENDATLRQFADMPEPAICIAAWGVGGGLLGRDAQVRKMFPRLHVLRLTKGGHPAHPLYLPKTLKPTLWPDLVGGEE